MARRCLTATGSTTPVSHLVGSVHRIALRFQNPLGTSTLKLLSLSSTSKVSAAISLTFISVVDGRLAKRKGSATVKLALEPSTEGLSGVFQKFCSFQVHSCLRSCSLPKGPPISPPRGFAILSGTVPPLLSSEIIQNYFRSICRSSGRSRDELPTITL